MQKQVDLKDYESELSSIAEVVEATAGFLNKDELVRLVIEKIIALMGLKLPSVYLLDDTSNKLFLEDFAFPRVMVRVAEATLGSSVRKISYPMSESDNLLVMAINEQEIKSTSDMADFTRPLLNEKVARGISRTLGLRLMLAIPLVVKGEAIGALAVAHNEKVLEERKKKILSLFANKISIAIYNARLFSQVQEQVDKLDKQKKDLESLFELSKASIKKLRSEDTVQEILDTVPQQFSHLGYVGAGFFRYDEDNKKIIVDSMTSGDVFEKLTNFSVKNGSNNGYSVVEHPSSMFAKALLEEKIITFEDFSEINPSTKNAKDIKVFQKDLGIKSGIMKKVFLRGLIPGILFIAVKRSADEIDERDERIANSLVNNFSLAYENAQLYQKTLDQLDEVREANEELKRLDEAKTNFVSIASHQLRTPVSGVRGYLSMMFEGDFGELNDKQKEVAEMNLANLERLNKLIDTFLDVTKIEAGKLVLEKELCDMSEIVAEVLGEFDHQVSVKGIELTFKQPEKGSAVMCDPERIRHAVANLIDNAIKYTPEGSIEVSMEIRENKELIKVKDTGVGLKPDEANHLFEKFVRASGGSRINANGSGLGLYIVKKIVEGHDGKVWVESPGEGRGSTFYIELIRENDIKRAKRKKEKKQK